MASASDWVCPDSCARELLATPAQIFQLPLQRAASGVDLRNAFRCALAGCGRGRSLTLKRAGFTTQCGSQPHLLHISLATPMAVAAEPLERVERLGQARFSLHKPLSGPQASFLRRRERLAAVSRSCRRSSSALAAMPSN